MQEPSFWSNQEEANKKTKESKDLKRIIETADHLKQQYDDLLDLIDMGNEENDPEVVEDITTEFEEFKETFEDMRISNLLTGEYD